jgi:orotate phosphoribosyltransferase
VQTLIEDLTSRNVATILWKSGAIQIGDFLLSSGKRSHIYIDLRTLLGSPKDFTYIALTLSSLAGTIVSNHNIDCILGIATGGLAWASTVAFLLSLPLSYHRGKRKEHGLSKVIEGCDVRNRKILIIDDVSTTGESIAKACNDVKNLGGNAVAALVIVDRCQGSKKRLAREGLTLYRLTDLPTIAEVGLELGQLTEALYKAVLNEVVNENE